MSCTRHTLGCETWRASRTSLEQRLQAHGSLAQLLGQELERHRLAELEVVGAVDLAHAAHADALDHAVAAGEDVAGDEALCRSGGGVPGVVIDGSAFASPYWRSFL